MQRWRSSVTALVREAERAPVLLIVAGCESHQMMEGVEANASAGSGGTASSRSAEFRRHLAVVTIAVAMFLAAGCEPRRGTSVRDGKAAPHDQELPDDQALKRACIDDDAQCPAYREALEAMCARGDAEGCGRLAALVADGIGGPQDYVRARVLATDACAAGSRHGCNNLVVFAMNGRGGSRDLQEAYRAGMIACRNGWEFRRTGCKNLSLVLHKDDFVLDEAERAAANALACGGFAIRSCETLGSYLIDLHFEGKLAEDAYPAFRAVSLRMCQFGWGGHCWNLGYLVRHGIGGPSDKELTARAEQRACHLGEAGACATGQVPRDAHIRAWPRVVTATDGGDHLDRLSVLEDAWSPCSSEPGDDRVVTVAIELHPDRVPVLWAGGPRALVDCFEARFPWRDGDPAPPSEEVTLTIEFKLNTPEDP
jgi:TPR repeat protein